MRKVCIWMENWFLFRMICRKAPFEMKRNFSLKFYINHCKAVWALVLEQLYEASECVCKGQPEPAAQYSSDIGAICPKKKIHRGLFPEVQFDPVSAVLSSHWAKNLSRMKIREDVRRFIKCTMFQKMYTSNAMILWCTRSSRNFAKWRKWPVVWCECIYWPDKKDFSYCTR